jgi:putative flippase GtrA
MIYGPARNGVRLSTRISNFTQKFSGRRKRGHSRPLPSHHHPPSHGKKIAPYSDRAPVVAGSYARPVSAPRALVERFRHLVQELGKFGVVGATTYVVDTAILAGLRSTGVDPLLAKTISTAVAASLAFLGNRFWTWRDRERTGLRREYALYFLFNAVGLAIGLGCLGISHYWLGRIWPVLTTELADVVSANVVGMAMGTVFRFWAYRRFVFPPRNVTGDDALTTGK